MRRALLCCVGIILGLTAGLILMNAPDLYLFVDGWHSTAFTRMVGVGIIVEGALATLGAALCLGRAIVPLNPAPTQGGTTMPGAASSAGGGGPVLPICGILFLLASAGPFEQARFDSQMVEVENEMPGQWGPDILEADRRHERTEWIFGILWVVVGGALLGTPLILNRRVWQLGWPMNAVGWVIAVGGFLLSALGALVCFANGMMLEGARAELAYAGYLGVLAGAIVAVVGSIGAVLGKAKS